MYSCTNIQGRRFVPYTSSETKPQMVPMDLNIGFQGLALIQGQIYNRDIRHVYTLFVSVSIMYMYIRSCLTLFVNDIR